MGLYSGINEADLPAGALLQEFANRGDYTDCFVTRLNGNVAFRQYVEAFYTTRLFRAERFILKYLASKPSTDEEARLLSRNETHSFAAWNEYRRADNQLIMMDFRQQTCSWFMLQREEGDSRLYFGSAVMRDRKSASGNEMKWTYRCLLGFHRLYSKALLHATANRLSRLETNGSKTD